MRFRRKAGSPGQEDAQAPEPSSLSLVALGAALWKCPAWGASTALLIRRGYRMCWSVVRSTRLLGSVARARDRVPHDPQKFYWWILVLCCCLLVPGLVGCGVSPGQAEGLAEGAAEPSCHTMSEAESGAGPMAALVHVSRAFFSEKRLATWGHQLQGLVLGLGFILGCF